VDFPDRAAKDFSSRVGPCLEFVFLGSSVGRPSFFSLKILSAVQPCSLSSVLSRRWPRPLPPRMLSPAWKYLCRWLKASVLSTVQRPRCLICFCRFPVSASLSAGQLFPAREIFLSASSISCPLVYSFSAQFAAAGQDLLGFLLSFFSVDLLVIILMLPCGCCYECSVLIRAPLEQRWSLVSCRNVWEPDLSMPESIWFSRLVLLQGEADIVF
jgi:hypothetical protein